MSAAKRPGPPQPRRIYGFGKTAKLVAEQDKKLAQLTEDTLTRNRITGKQ